MLYRLRRHASLALCLTALSIGLAACSTATEPTDTDTTDATGTTDSSTSVELTLVVDDAQATDEWVATIEGTAPGAPVIVYVSTDADADASCPVTLAPVCLGFGG